MKRLLALRIILFTVPVITLMDVQLLAQNSIVVGHIKGLGNKPVVFGYRQQGKYKLDTITAVNDKFNYKPKLSDDGKIDIRVSRPRYTSFWYEQGTLNVSGSIDKPYKLLISGGPENEVFNQYHKSIEWPYEDKKRGSSDSVKAVLTAQEGKDILSFIQHNPLRKTSAYLLYWQTIYNEKLVDRYEKLLGTLSPQVQISYQGKEVAERLEVLRNQPVVGKPAPTFTLADTAGRGVSLNTYRGKYVLLDFWGHWCSPCIKSFPKLKQLQQSYGDDLVIIGIAAEYAEDKSEWIRTIKKNDLSWIQLSELMSDKGEVNTRYNINAFPTYLLIDKEGTVLERTLTIDQIEQKLLTLGKL